MRDINWYEMYFADKKSLTPLLTRQPRGGKTSSPLLKSAADNFTIKTSPASASFITKTRNFNCRSKLWIFPSSVFMGLRRIKKKFMLLELEFYAKICVFIPEVLLAVQRNTFLDWWLSWFRQGEYIIISSQLDWSLHHRQYHGPHKLRQNVDSDFTVPSDCYLCCLDL